MNAFVSLSKMMFASASRCVVKPSFLINKMFYRATFYHTKCSNEDLCSPFSVTYVYIIIFAQPIYRVCSTVSGLFTTALTAMCKTAIKIFGQSAQFSDSNNEKYIYS